MKLSIVALLFVALAEAASAKWSRGHQESNGSLRGLKGKKDKKGKKAKKGKGGVFNRIAVMPICEGLEDGCEDSTETVAEIVAASDDGMMLVYSDSQLEVLGAVNIEDPENPEHIGVVEAGGEPTSIAVAGDYVLACINTSEDYINTSGKMLVIDLNEGEILAEYELGGQPDSIAVSPDKTFAAIAIENERDEDLGDGELPQMPAGFLIIFDISSEDVTAWTMSKVEMTGLPGLYEDSDPEPEFVSINYDNIAVVTLQENNAIVLVDCATATVKESFSAGTVDLYDIDTEEEGEIDMSSNLTAVPREPDGVVWLGTSKYFATADEGDMLGGSRGFTIFNTDGDIVYTSGSEMEHIVAALGHYPEERSGNKGNEPENVAYGVYDGQELLFVNSERSSLVLIYDVSKAKKPKFLQALPAGIAPEGSVAIPDRGLLVVASEKDDRDNKVRSVLNIYAMSDEKVPQYPTLVSDEGENGLPIPWSALSGLSHGRKKTELYAVEDSFYISSRIFRISTKDYPAVITDSIEIVDSDGVFAAVEPEGEFSSADLAAMINEDGTVNIDQEGIVYNEDDEIFWIAHEGRGTYGDENRPVESLNFLFKVDFKMGVIMEVVKLPTVVNEMQLRFGFEGVTMCDEYVVVAFQRRWGEEEYARIGMYNTETGEWKFGMYPLDEPESPNGGWVGLSDLSHVENGKFLVLERDNQGGPDAKVKRIYGIEIEDMDVFEDGTVIEKMLIRDIVPDLLMPNGLVYEKIEGIAVTQKGEVWIVNDNDGVDDNSGETQLLNLGKIF